MDRVEAPERGAWWIIGDRRTGKTRRLAEWLVDISLEGGMEDVIGVSDTPITLRQTLEPEVLAAFKRRGVDVSPKSHGAIVAHDRGRVWLMSVGQFCITGGLRPRAVGWDIGQVESATEDMRRRVAMLAPYCPADARLAIAAETVLFRAHGWGEETVTRLPDVSLPA